MNNNSLDKSTLFISTEIDSSWAESLIKASTAQVIEQENLINQETQVKIDKSDDSSNREDFKTIRQIEYSQKSFGFNIYDWGKECETKQDAISFINPRTTKQSCLKTNYKSDEIFNKNPSETCTCSKTRCLRLYCICFREGKFCGESCKCTNCFNLPEYDHHRGKIIQQTKDIFKHSFEGKIVTTKSGKKINADGCRCKTNCNSKYCDCFKNTVGCSKICKCSQCKNRFINLDKDEVKMYSRNHNRKRKKIVINSQDKHKSDCSLSRTRNLKHKIETVVIDLEKKDEFPKRN